MATFLPAQPRCAKARRQRARQAEVADKVERNRLLQPWPEPQPFRKLAIFFSSLLIGDQKILRKCPFGIDPLRFAQESRAPSDARNLLDTEFVAGFRPDRLPFSEGAGEVRGPNRHGLPPCRA